MWQPRSSNGDQKEDNTLLQHSQLSRHGEFRHVSVRERQRSRLCGQNLRVPFLRTVLPTEVEESTRAMAPNGETKSFVSLPPRFDTWSLHDSSQRICHVTLEPWQHAWVPGYCRGPMYNVRTVGPVTCSLQLCYCLPLDVLAH